MATNNAVNDASAPFTVSAGDLTITAGNATLTAGDVSIGNVAAATTAPFTTFKKSRAGTTITTGDVLGEINFQGHDGTQYTVGSRITSTSSGTIASTRVASDLKFYTHADSTAAATVKLTISSDGTATFANQTGTYGVYSLARPFCAEVAASGASVGGYHFGSGQKTYLLVTQGSGGTSNGDSSLVWGYFGTRVPGNNYSILIGNDIGQSGTVTQRCIVIGKAAAGTPTGDITNSIVIGNNAFKSGSGGSNIVLGNQTAYYTRSANIIALGSSALSGTSGAYCTTDGNIAIGASALYYLTGTGAEAIAVGYNALALMTTGVGNTAVGYKSCQAVTTAGGITAVGDNSLYTATTPTNSTSIGYDSLKLVTTGVSNTACGYQAGNTITTGAYNSFYGNLAGSSCTSDDHSNIIIGNTGTAGDVHKIRIGTQGTGNGQQDATYIAGIYGVTPGGTKNVALVDSNGQLGSSATLAPELGGKNTVSESTTSNSVQMAVNTTYIATSTDGATLVTYTLPATAAVGDQVKVIGKSTAFWKVAQNATDTIFYGAATSTPGATGYASTAQIYASATFTCITASSIWAITEFAGTVTLT